MKRESLIELVTMYDAIIQLEDIFELFIGQIMSAEPRAGALGKINYVRDIIKRECNQSLVDDDLDICDREYIKILHNKSLTTEEKVDLLFN